MEPESTKDRDLYFLVIRLAPHFDPVQKLNRDFHQRGHKSRFNGKIVSVVKTFWSSLLSQRPRTIHKNKQKATRSKIGFSYRYIENI